MADEAALGIDQQGLQAARCDGSGDALQFLVDARALGPQADVGAPVGEQYQYDIAVALALSLLGHFERQQQGGCEWRAAAGRNLINRATQQFHAAGRRQQQVCRLRAEGEQRHFVAIHVGLFEQRVHGAFCLTHAIEGHAAARVHGEDEQGAGLALVALDANVLGAQRQVTVSMGTNSLPRSSCSQCGDDVDTLPFQGARDTRYVPAANPCGTAA